MNEERDSKKRAIELWDTGMIDTIEVGTTKGLQEIHRYLFQDVFPFAGEIRTVNLAKGNFRFAPVLFLHANLPIIDAMPEENFEQITNKYVEMNVAHPFREGSGRAMRIWLDVMLKKRLGVCVAWETIDKYSYLQAMERSPVNTLEITTLLQSALTSEIKNRDVYMRGVQASYAYEDFAAYQMGDIASEE